MDRRAYYTDIRESLERFYADEEIRQREYYSDFRRGWDALFKLAIEQDKSYFDAENSPCHVLHTELEGLAFDFHLDQRKIAEWYFKERQRKKALVFKGKKLKRRSGRLYYYEAECDWDMDDPEEGLDESARNIIACAVPALPARLAIVYGNKWVASRFTVFRPNTLDAFLIETDYVPAFLESPFEVCLFLFLMDWCIIKSNYQKVPAKDMRKILHIFRPSPMLKIKGLVQ